MDRRPRVFRRIGFRGDGAIRRSDSRGEQGVRRLPQTARAKQTAQIASKCVARDDVFCENEEAPFVRGSQPWVI